ncbi:hypothetical protein phiPsa267_030 [Pseudomonas phage phiPsa267]|uniref:Uncharacterized protein n=5 Tax=Otagovirus TaxID=2560197 RepID=A0A7G9V0X3_9CAUD|nr:hypothetical protein QGX14_gp031 [Pseudomonas phage psageK4]YP_010766940.1 hypothetical protein QGX15_gp035 [Pseudomonas phage psageK4e]YP_010767120.1 hypothetical protein QGX16_gp030 [Pseudomonas phage phiPsa397]YP_010767640.1 hypothetical protein QGX19_gp030 [Pseudomonas phage phiPsa267]YP_010767814.1 hypothetical protein QGX20_gp028 [Pseudomonas phage phiPsa300]QNN99928.1 hypothetical protein phiPsa267_030 [Pseudomonas phage phiPsa267]QNO00103.1 hypothetical protein phiPsa300_028 [Pseud
MELLIMAAIGSAVLLLIWLIVREPVELRVARLEDYKESVRTLDKLERQFEVEQAARVNAGIPRAYVKPVEKPVDKPKPKSYSSSSSRSSSGGSSYSSRSDDSYSSYSSWGGDSSSSSSSSCDSSSSSSSSSSCD